MKRNRSSISKARSYAEIGEYWDTHDLSDVWGKTRKVKFDVVAEPEATYYPIEKDLLRENPVGSAETGGFFRHSGQSVARAENQGTENYARPQET